MKEGESVWGPDQSKCFFLVPIRGWGEQSSAHLLFQDQLSQAYRLLSKYLHLAEKHRTYHIFQRRERVVQRQKMVTFLGDPTVTLPAETWAECATGQTSAVGFLLASFLPYLGILINQQKMRRTAMLLFTEQGHDTWNSWVSPAGLALPHYSLGWHDSLCSSPPVTHINVSVVPCNGVWGLEESSVYIFKISELLYIYICTHIHHIWMKVKVKQRLQVEHWK